MLSDLLQPLDSCFMEHQGVGAREPLGDRGFRQTVFFCRTGTKGAFTINYMRAGCRLMLKDDLVPYMAAASASVHAKHENLQEGRNGHLLSHFRQQVSNQAADLVWVSCCMGTAWTRAMSVYLRYRASSVWKQS